ncbi:Repeat domain-containing protein [Senna tora]|uniref:Repeat domain-containing protein n=1 Tax=Senna tora TaxID=362788 RepID=A0A834T1P5_9FABA|nr:Repeat domain-containing protein [Senna tora]
MRQKTCCASKSNTSVRVVFANQSGFDARIGVVLAWEELGPCLNIFRMKKITVGSQKPSRITRQKTCFASVSNTSVRILFVNRRGFDAPIGVVLAWEQRGSCLNIIWMKNRGQISETFPNYKAKDLLRKSLDHVSTYSGRQKLRSDLRNLHELRGKRLVAQVCQTSRFALYSQTRVVLMLQLESSWHGRSVDHVSAYSERQITVGSQKPSRMTRQKTCCASESNTSVCVVFANRSGFDAPIGVVLAWEERGSCLNVFQTTNCDRIIETFTNNEPKDLLRNKSNTSVRVVFANRSGFHAPIGVVLACEERGSCLNIFWMTNRGQISETFANYEATDMLCKSNLSVNIVFANRSGFNAPIGVVLAWEERGSCLNIFRESNKSVRVVFANRSGFDAPNGVVLSWEERGSCLNIFRTTNRGRISETFTNYEAKDLLRKLETCCANESNTSVRVVFANRSGFDAPIGVVLAWEEHGSCLNIFRTTNHGRISETFTNYEAKDSLRK